MTTSSITTMFFSCHLQSLMLQGTERSLTAAPTPPKATPSAQGSLSPTSAPPRRCGCRSHQAPPGCLSRWGGMGRWPLCDGKGQGSTNTPRPGATQHPHTPQLMRLGHRRLREFFWLSPAPQEEAGARRGLVSPR